MSIIAIRVPCFIKRAQRNLSQHPKFYYFDTGVFQAIRPRGPLDLPTEINGPAFETLFLQHLRAVIDYYRYDLQIYFWRTATGVEVDFIVYGENGLFAFELKGSTYIERKDCRGLNEFHKDYPIAKCYLIYNGEHEERFDNVLALPMKKILFKLAEILKAKV